MSGTIRYKLNNFNNDLTNWKNNQAVFTSLYKFFKLQEASGQAVFKALNYGSGGTGTDYWDGANPFGENAFFVVEYPPTTLRANSYYLLFQWADATAFGSAPGNPGLLDGSAGKDGVGVAMAMRADGGNPWNGTMNVDGADTKGTPVWTAGPSTLIMFTSRNQSGATATNREDLEEIDDFISTSRTHIIGDADTTFIYSDNGDNGSSDAICAFGAYAPLGNFTIANPLFQMNAQGGNVPAPANIFDDSVNFDGQMIGEGDTSSQDYYLSGSIDGVTVTGGAQPSFQGGVSQYVEVPIFITQKSGVNSGVAGTLPQSLVGYVFGVPGNDVNAAGDRAFLPSLSTQDSLKWSIAWAGAQLPGSGASKDGTEV